MVSISNFTTLSDMRPPDTRSAEPQAGLQAAAAVAAPPMAPLRGAEGTAALREADWSAQGLANRLGTEPAAFGEAGRRYRLRVPHYYAGLIEGPGDPIWRQCVPSPEERDEPQLAADPFAEDDPRHAPTPHLTHRYPHRALLLVTDLCPMYCRFCMRKRKTLEGAAIGPASIAAGIAHIRRTPAIREVILSGGDPLMLPDGRLGAILAELRAIPHVALLRVHTRMPCVEPARITAGLARELARAAPLWVAVHFNHPREVTPQARAALALLAGAGLPLNNQAVLLRGVNDDAAVLAELFRRLIRCGVHPYYLHHSDLVPGTAQFRVPVQEGLEIVRRLRELAPELAMLHYVLDTPGGGGKVPLGFPAR
ncbi:MAG: KamA family radical SAM protein [Candidatus Lambdaproteobacteria bacterium]|nr:KamA family radical SAM protein [Candidatus Lambdaproteobacteria bacterium]